LTFFSFALWIGTKRVDYITFLKGYDADFPKISKLSINLAIEKKFSQNLVCKGVGVIAWAVVLFSSAYFDKIVIFVLSKDQTFRK
jgi:hypothetical protein